MFPQNINHGESSTNSQPQASSHMQGLGLGFDHAFAHASTVEEEDEWMSEESDAEPGTDDIKGKGKAKATTQADDKRTSEERIETSRKLAVAEKARTSISQAALAAKGISWSAEQLFEDEGRDLEPIATTFYNPRTGDLKNLHSRKRHDFFSNMANMPELFMELAKHLRIKDLLSLYSISIDFHETINGHLSHCMRRCAEHMAPESAKLYQWKFYGWLCVEDPAGRANVKKQGEVRLVPSLKWLQMVVHREKTVRDILALMARQGHRMPVGMKLSLKKMWFLMDISTNNARSHLIHNVNYFTDFDLYNIQLFIVKLDMRFNDPIDGPGDENLRKLFLGQRGLSPLCKLLKRTAYREIIDITRLGLRYAYQPRPEHRGMDMYGVPAEEIGVGHTEGWGAGRVHLMRPDELMMVESVRRQMGLKNYIMNMMTWGYIDPITGMNIPVSEEEMFMSEPEEEPTKTPLFQNYQDYEVHGGDTEEEEDREMGELEDEVENAESQEEDEESGSDLYGDQYSEEYEDEEGDEESDEDDEGELGDIDEGEGDIEGEENEEDDDDFSNYFFGSSTA